MSYNYCRMIKMTWNMQGNSEDMLLSSACGSYQGNSIYELETSMINSIAIDSLCLDGGCVCQVSIQARHPVQQSASTTCSSAITSLRSAVQLILVDILLPILLAQDFVVSSSKMILNDSAKLILQNSQGGCHSVMLSRHVWTFTEQTAFSRCLIDRCSSHRRGNIGQDANVVLTIVWASRVQRFVCDQGSE